MSNLYKTRVNAYGGRSGTIRSEDGILDMPLALPKELGGKGGATNPEQLFAAGYAACFENAVIHVTRTQADKVRDEDIEVSCEVGLAPNGEDGFKLVVALDVESLFAESLHYSVYGMVAETLSGHLEDGVSPDAG